MSAPSVFGAADILRVFDWSARLRFASAFRPRPKLSLIYFVHASHWDASVERHQFVRWHVDEVRCVAVGANNNFAHPGGALLDASPFQLAERATESQICIKIVIVQVRFVLVLVQAAMLSKVVRGVLEDLHVRVVAEQNEQDNQANQEIMNKIKHGTLRKT